MTDALNAIRPGSAAFIIGKTPEEKRTEIYQSYLPGGTIQHLINVMVATEGYDNPYIQHVFDNAPTKSRVTFAQKLGRVTRLWPDIDLSGGSDDRKERIALSMKPVGIYHDFVGNSGKHKLITPADILGANDAINAEVVRRIRKSGKPADIAQLMLKVAKEQEERERISTAKEYQKGKASYRTSFVDPFNLFQVSDVRSSRVDGCVRLSERQITALQKAGYDPTLLSSTQGKQILGGLGERWKQNLATPKQVKLLRDKGVPDAEKIPFQTASNLITKIANNRWQFEPSMMK